MTVLPAIEPHPDQVEDPTGQHVAGAYLATIKHAIVNHPRSLQKRIGPSEVGHSCARRTGYKLLGFDDINATDDVPWLPTVGTGGHLWCEEVFTAANDGLGRATWLVEQRVSVGDILGTEITGSSDLFHCPTGTVIDHKFVGATTLRKYKAKGPSPEYRAQAHLYGRGFTRRGLPVRRVMIAFLPRNSELRDAYLWSEPYDEQIALDALERATGIALTVGHLGPDGLAQLQTADAYCQRCPFYKRGSTDPATGCPGHPAGDQERRQDQILSLI